MVSRGPGLVVQLEASLALPQRCCSPLGLIEQHDCCGQQRACQPDWGSHAPRTQGTLSLGQQLRDRLSCIGAGQIFEQQGKALDKVAKKNVKVMVSICI